MVVEVELARPHDIDRVEVWLDGVLVADLAKGEVQIEVDFGQENRPARLEVRAFSGRELRGSDERRFTPIQVHEKVDLELQQIYVTVTDRGRRVLDLERGAFRIFDEGKRQDIVTFAHGNVAFTAVLLLDVSGSMRGLQLEHARAGAAAFVGGMLPHDEVMLLAFADRIRLATGFESGPAGLLARLEPLEAGEGTAVLDHLYLSLVRLERRQGRRVVILLSDGGDLHSGVAPQDLAELGRLSQALVYWVRLDPPSIASGSAGGSFAMQTRRFPMTSWRSARDSEKVFKELQNLVERSGGRVVPVTQGSDIERAFSEILSELREQYALGYYADPRHDDGRWRDVRTEIKNKRYRVRARSGYVDR